MVKLNARFDGKVIVPDEPLALKPNQRVHITVELIASPPARIELGKQPGCITYFAPDWEAPPEDIWAFEEKKRSCCSRRSGAAASFGSLARHL